MRYGGRLVPPDPGPPQRGSKRGSKWRRPLVHSSTRPPVCTALLVGRYVMGVVLGWPGFTLFPLSHYSLTHSLTHSLTLSSLPPPCLPSGRGVGRFARSGHHWVQWMAAGRSRVVTGRRQFALADMDTSSTLQAQLADIRDRPDMAWGI